MSTKDPHIALIDAHEELEKLRAMSRAAAQQLSEKMAKGYALTEDDKQEMRKFRQKMIDAAKRIQDELFEELEGHGRLT